MRSASHPVPPPAVLQLSLPCELQATRQAADQVRTFLERHGCPQQAVADSELALVEACTNAVRHADARARQLPLGIEASFGPDGIELRILDHTPGFDWPERPGLPPAHEE